MAQLTEIKLPDIGDFKDIPVIEVLVKPGEKIQPGQIYESNSVLLGALLQRCGASTKSVEHCCDDRSR